MQTQIHNQPATSRTVGRFNPQALLGRVLDNRVAETIIEQPVMSYYLQDLNPLWSLKELRARVVEVIDETHDAKTFVLRPNWRWSGFVAGQNVGVNVEIDGVTQRRRYSMSCGEASGKTFQITVKRVAGGRVSNWLHDNVQAGDVLDLSPPAGDFVLPAQLPGKLLMLGGGSGITPLMSQLETLLDADYAGDIQLLYFVRSPADRIFGEYLDLLANEYPNLRVQWCFEDDRKGGKPERFSARQIARRVPDYQERQTLLCGPAGFMEAVREHWAAKGLSERLQFEYFGTPPVATADGVEAQVSLSRKTRDLTAAPNQSLLEALENAGETPVYGCRMGICHECKCHKSSGSVRNVLTGEVSSGDEDIQLCVSVAVSDVTLTY